MRKLEMDEGGGFFTLRLNIIDEENTINSLARKCERRLFSSGATASVKRPCII